jgi:hypothetical protein
LEDFIIDRMPSRYASVDVVVPIGAHYLFIGTENSYAGYNSDPNCDFAVTITPVVLRNNSLNGVPLD